MTVKLLLLVFVSLQLHPSAGLISEGPCPSQSESTVSITEMKLERRLIIASVPFESRKSYLFYDFSLSTHPPHCHSLTWNFDGVIFKHLCPPLNFDLLGYTTGNESYKLNSTLFHAECESIQEVVSIWKIAQGVIIYSCEALENSQKHDEALLLLTHPQYYYDEDGEEYSAKVEGFQLNIGLFVQSTLKERIPWPAAGSDPYSCGEENISYTMGCMDVEPNQFNLNVFFVCLLVVLVLCFVSNTALVRGRFRQTELRSARRSRSAWAE